MTRVEKDENGNVVVTSVSLWAGEPDPRETIHGRPWDEVFPPGGEAEKALERLAQLIQEETMTDQEPRDDPEETLRLALESVHRWGGRYRLSPAMRLRAIRAVVEAALSDG